MRRQTSTNRRSSWVLPRARPWRRSRHRACRTSQRRSKWRLLAQESLHRPPPRLRRPPGRRRPFQLCPSRTFTSVPIPLRHSAPLRPRRMYPLASISARAASCPSSRCSRRALRSTRRALWRLVGPAPLARPSRRTQKVARTAARRTSRSESLTPSRSRQRGRRSANSARRSSACSNRRCSAQGVDVHRLVKRFSCHSSIESDAWASVRCRNERHSGP